MPSKDDLIRENAELRVRLGFAEKWMRREVNAAIRAIRASQSQKSTRKTLTNMFESEGVDMIAQRILQQFDTSVHRAPKYTIERLIDAEIYWKTLQQYPQMDALPIILAYQKIIDAWLEERLIAGFRSSMQSDNHHFQQHSTERDIQNIFTKGYSLSIGRFYQILSMIRQGESLGPLSEKLVAYWNTLDPDIVPTFTSDEYYAAFSELMEREVFTRKRHESKVTYSDAKVIRAIMIDASQRKSFLEIIFSI